MRTRQRSKVPLLIASILLLAAVMFAGLLAMLIGERFKQEMESQQLNEALARHQKKS